MEIWAWIEIECKHRLPLLDCKIELDRAGFYILFGISGSGKSSLLDALVGLLPTAEVELRVDSLNIAASCR